MARDSVDPVISVEISGLVSRLSAGELDRRAFLRAATKLGLSIPAACALAAPAPGAPNNVAPALPDKASLDSHMSGVLRILNNKKFLTSMQRALQQPETMRYDAIKKAATVKALKDAGVPLPKGLRITTRVFEDPTNLHPTGRSEIIEACEMPAVPSFPNEVNACGSVGFIGCVSVGA